MGDFCLAEGRVKDPGVLPLPRRNPRAPLSLQGRPAASLLAAAPTPSVGPNGQTDPGAASTLLGPFGAKTKEEQVLS